MRPWALPLLRCLECRSALESHVIERREDRVMEGLLVCGDPACRAWYPIANGVPRILGGRLRHEAMRHAGKAHKDLVGELGLVAPTRPGEDELSSLKQATIASFGFEWTSYRRFGWDDPVYNLDREQGVFLRKSLLRPDELRDRLVLDAGCGNGRYAHLASKHGARVIGIDLSAAVDSAAENTDGDDAVQIVQGDIFNLPFAAETFDIVFSIGVLMHTGDARSAVACLRELLSKDGSLTVHLYGRGNAIYEAVDRRLRAWTTRRSVRELERFTDRAYRLERRLSRFRLTRIVNRFVRLDPHPHCIFDWYSAPIATHHTYPEVRGWFSDLGLRVVATNELRSDRGLGAVARRIARSADTVTVRGQTV